MALVARTHPFELVITLVDNGGNETSKSYELQSADAAAAATDSAAIIAALNAVTEAVIKRYSINHVFVENALVLPASGVENQNQAILTVQLASDPTKTGTLVIPAADPDIFAAASGENANIVDTGDADVNTYVELFTSTNEAYMSDGELADPGLSFKGVRRHVKSRYG
jgi:hypothetical protein